ncbi:hypothetical protein BV25DRAFT_237649 [Artomyces pyxidatus]|uniref:Uncharacterized protein n=1 Tax=Artomyces pyxidatus TaxID=48021 RepID=A0ACB8T8G7_9AGAM|nr:hypothetical protein BV25DRAFT_237649 [Artomyces pyxidatus]
MYDEIFTLTAPRDTSMSAPLNSTAMAADTQQPSASSSKAVHALRTILADSNADTSTPTHTGMLIGGYLSLSSIIIYMFLGSSDAKSRSPPPPRVRGFSCARLRPNMEPKKCCRVCAVRHMDGVPGGSHAEPPPLNRKPSRGRAQGKRFSRDCSQIA